MNRIITNSVSAVKGQPLVADSGTGSIPFLQDGVQEALWNMLLGIIGSYTTNDLIVLDGVVVTLSTTTISNDTATWTAGSIGYNGEIYTVDAGSVVKTSGQTFVFKTLNTFHPTLDPIVFSDNSSNSVHQVRKITIVAGASGSGIADYNASSVKQLINATNTGFSITSSTNLTSPTLTVCHARKKANDITYSLTVTGNITAGNSFFSVGITCPAGFKMKATGLAGNYGTGMLVTTINGAIDTITSPPDDGSSNVTGGIDSSNILIIDSANRSVANGSPMSFNLTLTATGL